MKQTKVTIIGAGASGMMAAITAARNGSKVTLLEHNSQAGKKLLATGNGRCNLTNLEQSPTCYRSDNPDFVRPALERFSAGDTIRAFHEMGIYTKNKNGCLYPYSEQAQAVRDVLEMELSRQQIQLICNTSVTRIEKSKKGFCVHTNTGSYTSDTLVLAAGSKAAPKSGSDGSGYALAKALGHRIIEPLPALVQLICEGGYFKSLAGVRCDAALTLLVEGKERAFDRGELQLAGYGISGIVTFQISRYAVRAVHEGRDTSVLINFMPDFDEETFIKFLKNRLFFSSHKTMEQFFIGVLNKKLIPVLLKKAHLSENMSCSEIKERQLLALAAAVLRFPVRVQGFQSFEQAQVCSGGVDTRELNPATMESGLIKGLFFAGEIMDVDGICGGYNLQWAWSSGYLAGCHAALKSTVKA